MIVKTKTTGRQPKPRTKFDSVRDDITARINSGIYSGKLPGVQQLGKELNANPQTVSKVLDELEEQGLIKKYERVGTFVNRKRRIGLLIFSGNHNGSHFLGGNSIFDKIISGITSELEPKHYTLHTCMASPRHVAFINQLKREVDGLIIVRSGGIEDKDFAIFSDIPWILAMGEYNNTLNATMITYNNDVIGRMAADYLLEQKCSRFIYYGHEKGTIFTCRWESFMARIASHGFKADKVFVNPYEQTLKDFFEESCRQLEPLLKNRKQVGIFMPSDIVGQVLYQILYKYGRSPLEDKIIACDNNTFNLHGMYPYPPSIDIRMWDIGKKAAESLLQIITGEIVDKHEHIILMPELYFAQDRYSLSGWEVCK